MNSILSHDSASHLPGHTDSDGDILFAATTREVENPQINDLVLSHIASELVWDAVLSCVGG